MKNDFRNGFRIVGGCFNERRLVDSNLAFEAYADCDSRAEIEKEAYLSAYCFSSEFAEHLSETGSTKGYIGPTWSEWLWFDIDRDDRETALNDTKRLVEHLINRFGTLAGDELLIFYSGSKGFHVGLPTWLWSPEPSIEFHSCCRLFAETIAEQADVIIDSGVYDRVRAFRAPNSRHPKTGRHKRFFELWELMSFDAEEIVYAAMMPKRFFMPPRTRVNSVAVRQWNAACELVRLREMEVETRRKRPGQVSTCVPTHFSVLNRSSFEFIRDGASSGDRHRRLFSAAANLAEFSCSFELAWALLSESALDSGLSPGEVRRQIECGLAYRGVA